MSPKNVQILTRCAELLNVGDWDALFELYHPEVIVEFREVQPLPDIPDMLRGRDGIRRIVEHWTAPYDEFGAEIYQYIDADPWVICDTRWYRKGELSDVTLGVRFADAYEVENGKIRRAIIGYPDVASAVDELEPTR